MKLKSNVQKTPFFTVFSGASKRAIRRQGISRPREPVATRARPRRGCSPAGKGTLDWVIRTMSSNFRRMWSRTARYTPPGGVRPDFLSSSLPARALFFFCFETKIQGSILRGRIFLASKYDNLKYEIRIIFYLTRVSDKKQRQRCL